MKGLPKMKKLTKKMNALFISVMVITLAGILITALGYHNIQQEALKMGKSQLEQVNEVSTKLIVAEIQSSANDLDSFVTDTMNTQTSLQLPQQNKLISQFFRRNHAFSGIFLFDTKGKQLEGHFSSENQVENKKLAKKLITDPIFAKALKGDAKQNGKVYFIQQNSFFNLYHPIYNAQKEIQGLVVVPLNLEQLFLDKIQPTDTAQRYPLMKNEKMEVVMHPAKEQIGLNIITGRKKRFPTLDYTDLEKLDVYQKQHEKGSLSYHSYWWNEADLTSVLKLNAFQWVEIGEDRFVIANTSDFYQDNGWILHDLLINLGLVVILLMVASLLVLMVRLFAKQQHTINENQRLKEKRQLEAEKHQLEKSLLQESKMETIGLVTTGIVHDMNNFLTPLIGNIELLMAEHTNDAELLGDLEDMHYAAKKGQQLSQRILHFSKEADQIKKIQSLNQAVEEAVTTMKILIPKTVTITKEINLSADALFQQDDVQVLLYNLITNAYQAKADATITVSLISPSDSMYQKITARAFIYQNKKLAMIQVSDNGPGIDSRVKDKIFTPFLTTRKEEGGTGLGLFIVSSIVKRNSWLMEVDSSEKGTSFSLIIPIAENKEVN
ncbi:sensor histidine kinase [Enterococcus saigonensis]